VAGCCQCGDEPSVSCSTELVSLRSVLIIELAGVVLLSDVTGSNLGRIS
jgi:hypothetical protein